MASPAHSLYDRIGSDLLDQVVYRFYDRVLQDERLRNFFKNTDVRNIARHQYLFIMSATGGPDRYKGRELRDAHRQLVLEKGLSDTHFDAIKENLKLTLEEVGIGYNTSEELMAAVEGFRTDVLNR